MIIIRKAACARAGLLGNPSDGYNGRTISVIIRNFKAEVVLYEWGSLDIVLSANDRAHFQHVLPGSQVEQVWLVVFWIRERIHAPVPIIWKGNFAHFNGMGPTLPDVMATILAYDDARGAPLRTLCERAKSVAVLPCYADSERDLARLIDEEMRAAGLTIAPDARAALVSLIGGDRQASRSEAQKLALYAHGQSRIEIDDITRTRRTAGQPFALSDRKQLDALMFTEEIPGDIVNFATVKFAFT